MQPREQASSLKYWDEHYTSAPANKSNNNDSWLKKYDPLLQCITNPVLDLGCGDGDDTAYLIHKGLSVIACDQSAKALTRLESKYPKVYQTKCFDMLDGIPFADHTFELIVAGLSLHYFHEQDTIKIFQEIHRVLMSGGFLIFSVNSIHSANDRFSDQDQSKEIEHHLYRTKNYVLRRFFDENDLHHFLKDFRIITLQEETTAKYGSEKLFFSVCVQKNS